MNPLRHLPTDFNNLTTPQLWEVIRAYCDQNNYPPVEIPQDKRITPKMFFENEYHPWCTLKAYFEDWQL
jgi:hypothetical protein